jgi:hypothetical protein
VATVVIENPTNMPEAADTGYVRQNTQLFTIRTGFMRIGVANMDNTGAPAIQAGSVLEVNGALYKSAGDEAVGGSPVAGECYVYAVPGEGGVSFQYAGTKPAWSAVKGGWYNGNNRAVCRLTYSSGSYMRKMIMDVFNYKAAYSVDPDIPIPDSGGTLVWQAAKVNQVEQRSGCTRARTG